MGDAATAGCLPAALLDQLLRSLRQAQDLQQADDPEDQPYRSLYAAGDLLKDLLARLPAAEPSGSATSSVAGGEQPPRLRAEAAAWVACERGLALLQTDLLHDGEQQCRESLRHAWHPSRYSCALQLRAHNALGLLAADRGQHDAALQHLVQAQQHYSAAKATWPAPAAAAPDGADSAAPDGADSDEAGAGEERAQCLQLPQLQQQMASACGMTLERLEQDNCTTLVALAQVTADAGRPEASAVYCAQGLNAYLATGTYVSQLDDWVQNCLQLSAYYMDVRAWGVAAYCQAAVDALLARHGIQPAKQLKEDAQQQQQQQQQTVVARAPSPDAAPAAASDQRASTAAPRPPSGAGREACDDGAEACRAPPPPPPSEPRRPSGPAAPAQLRLSQDVAANVLLAKGKLLLARLVASHAASADGERQAAGPFDAPEAMPACLRFDSLEGLPPLDALPWGAAALFRDYAAALGAVREALPLFQGALGYYQLDGWVTEHVRLLFDMSNMYRLLAAFEPEPHRACVTHKRRVHLLGPLEGALSPAHYPGLARSISLELGNTFRAIHEIKEAAGWPPAKVAAAARQAAQHYQLFLESYSEGGGGGGKQRGAGAGGGGGGAVPEGLAPQDLDLYLQASFDLGRVLHKCGVTSGDVAPLQQSLARLRGAAAYVQRRGLAAWAREAQLAQELADLVASKVDLTHRLAELQATRSRG